MICPTDLHRCERGDCLNGQCQIANDSPLLECAECGVLLVVPASYGMCVACVKGFEVETGGDDIKDSERKGL